MPDNVNLPEEDLANLKGEVLVMSLSNNSIELIGSQDIPIRNHVDGRFSERDAVLGVKNIHADRNDDENIPGTANKTD